MVSFGSTERRVGMVEDEEQISKRSGPLRAPSTKNGC